MATLQEKIDGALRTVTNPRLGRDVVSAEMVRDVEQVDGVTDVRVDPRDPAEFAPKPKAPSAAPGGGSRALPVMDAAPQNAQRGVPAPQPVTYPLLGKIIAVSSGKGGVGKSTVASNLAVTLAQRGVRVGILDADIYGPNIPRMLGVDGPLPVNNATQKIIPNAAHGVKIVSLGFLIERDQPAIWRGPIVMKIITQFLRDVEWGQLDVLLVDMPPGTGDAQLSLVQATQVSGAVIVTTPQAVAVGDALRGAKMFERVGVPVYGIVENMSWFVSPETGQPIAMFGSGGGQSLADELGVPLLGHVPLYPRIVQSGDDGKPIVASDPTSAAAKALDAIATRVLERAGVTAGR